MYFDVNHNLNDQIIRKNHNLIRVSKNKSNPTLKIKWISNGGSI